MVGRGISIGSTVDGEPDRLPFLGTCRPFSQLQQGELLVYVWNNSGPRPSRPRRTSVGVRAGRNTDDLVLGRRLRVVDDKDVDTIFRRLNLQPELFLQCRKESRTVRAHRRQRRVHLLAVLAVVGPASSRGRYQSYP